MYITFPCKSISQALPSINELKSDNPVFMQYQEDVQTASKLYSREKKSTLIIYSYKARSDDTVFSVAARCSVSYDSIVTLNGISSTDEILDKRTLYLPVQNGLYLKEFPETSIEQLALRENFTDISSGNTASFILDGKKIYFLPEKKFTPADRAFFLDNSMILPVEKSVLTSPFGMRISPISGTLKFHNGIDLAAEEGTDVLCCKNGIVTETKTDEVYGKYITITHANGMKSFYAHLSKILVKKGDKVTAGKTIGKIGHTGAATGPHLHFEIILNGKSNNPENFFEIQ